MTDLAARRDRMKARLEALGGPAARLERLIAEAHAAPPRPEIRLEAHEVPGCVAPLWLACTWRDGRCCFAADSDSMVTKAVAGLLCEFASDATPEEILAADLSFLRELGIADHLGANRRVALTKVWGRIRAYAQQGQAAPAPAVFLDAHNHLQDERFAGRQDALLAEAQTAGVRAMVVNGSCEADWPAVLALARRHPTAVIPSFGVHPWYVAARTPSWEEQLARLLDETPAAVGEIGLDRGKRDLSYDSQEEVFVRQLRLAAERDRPASVHCLGAWGRMMELLRAGPRPARGFLLHSYGGPADLVRPLADLGAYFSLPGYFARADKEAKREAFRRVPPDRLLLETDAPDQLPPPDLITHPLPAPEGGRPLNHPAHLAAVYRFAAELCREPLDALAARVAANFARLFGPRPP